MLTRILNLIPGVTKNPKEPEEPKQENQPKKKKIWLEEPIVGKKSDNKVNDGNADTSTEN